MIAGGSRAAARRAAEHGQGFISQTDDADLKAYYESQCRLAGHEPGLVQFPVPGTPTTVFVADDIDEAWDLLGPHLLHDAVTGVVPATRRLGGQHHPCRYRGGTQDDRWAVPDLHPGREAADYVRTGRPLPLHPLCGGIPPDVAWRYLEIATAANDAAAVRI